jgi:V/A-type H+-transporting ATPase subunit C
VALLFEEARLTRDAMRYGFAVGKVKVLESRALDRAALERLLDARTFADQKRLLADTPYGRYLEPTRTADEVEQALDEALDDAYGFLRQAALPEPVARFFRVRHDFANLKAALKALALDVPANDLLVGHGSVEPEAFLGDLAALPDPLGTTARGILRVPMDGGPEIENLDPMTIDMLVDRAMYAELLGSARRSKSAFLTDLAVVAIDSANVRIIVRARRAGMGSGAIRALFIEGGTVPIDDLVPLTTVRPEEIAKELGRFPALRALGAEALDDPAVLDLAVDGLTAQVLRRGRLAQVGPEPVITYVFAREAEIAALRVLLLGTLAGLDRETVRRRLRVAS